MSQSAVNNTETKPISMNQKAISEVMMGEVVVVVGVVIVVVEVVVVVVEVVTTAYVIDLIKTTIQSYHFISLKSTSYIGIQH